MRRDVRASLRPDDLTRGTKSNICTGKAIPSLRAYLITELINLVLNCNVIVSFNDEVLRVLLATRGKKITGYRENYLIKLQKHVLRFFFFFC
jgi:hypothetical protein